MQSRNIRFVIWLMIPMLFCSLLYSQSLESSVTLTLELLPLEKQEKLKDFAETIERYINEYEWLDEEYEEPLPITISLQLQEASSSYEDRYSGIFMISNNSDMQYYDKYWRFPYSPEAPIDHGDVYHPFTGYLDFYIYIILAGEFDKLGPMMGTPFYEKAKQVADQAAFDAQFSTGWKERSEFIARLMGEENKAFREMKDRFYLGLSYVEDDDALVKKYCLEAVDLLDEVLEDDPEHKDAVNFLKAHHMEIIEVFKNQTDVLSKMIRLDPDRADTYEKYLQ
ncbi:DUF4835 family protein [bacterium]